jgi:hypothetical protein
MVYFSKFILECDKGMVIGIIWFTLLVSPTGAMVSVFTHHLIRRWCLHQVIRSPIGRDSEIFTMKLVFFRCNSSSAGGGLWGFRFYPYPDHKWKFNVTYGLAHNNTRFPRRASSG